MSEFPKMMYKYPGTVQLQDGAYAHVIVENAEGEAEAAEAGYFRTMPEARTAYETGLRVASEAANKQADDKGGNPSDIKGNKSGGWK